jgi:DNA-binding response OmpR family regulator
MDKILVVDDESDIVNLLKLILETEGFQVLTAFGGDEALNLAEVEIPDLVLLDLLMPGKSGLEVCKILKSQPKTKNVPVIVLSALGRNVDRELSTEAGAEAHLTKPFTNSGLLTETRRCLNETRSWKFSKQLGIEHSRLLGKKILLEIDPRTDYGRIVRDFALECAFLGDTVIVTTQTGSSVRQALQDDNEIHIINVDLDNGFQKTLNEYSRGPISLVFDSLTDLALAEQSETNAYKGMYKFAKDSLQTLNDPRITALFLFNPSAHDPKDVASLRGLFNNQLVYEKRGVSIARLG